MFYFSISAFWGSCFDAFKDVKTPKQHQLRLKRRFRILS